MAVTKKKRIKNKELKDCIADLPYEMTALPVSRGERRRKEKIVNRQSSIVSLSLQLRSGQALSKVEWIINDKAICIFTYNFSVLHLSF